MSNQLCHIDRREESFQNILSKLKFNTSIKCYEASQLTSSSSSLTGTWNAAPVSEQELLEPLINCCYSYQAVTL